MAKGISRELIVQTALDLLDEQGIDGVTARALAHRLGVKAPALYWHMASKQEILDEMGTEISRRVAAALSDEPQGETWSDGLAAYARVLRREYLAHRDGARTFSGTKLTDPGVLRAQEPWLERLVASGISLEHGVAAAQLVTAFVVGFVIEEQERSGDRYPLAERDAALGDDAPLVRASGRYLFEDPAERFEAYLDVVLAGVAARYPTKEQAG
ncbi:TetR/AcrR family transcriptional regulator C-terminal domain-containing protein [Propionicimonas sp.]|uniref:TetR/AcrR family transcriptional regulator C-terminal domain-containing protein n=1 Tax=Propionicimonas sp. TaxID=1955623 RepID=UPI0039E6681B